MYSALDLSGKQHTYRSCFSSNLLTMSGSSEERRSLFLTNGVSPPQPSAGSLTQKKKTWGWRSRTKHFTEERNVDVDFII